MKVSVDRCSLRAALLFAGKDAKRSRFEGVWFLRSGHMVACDGVRMFMLRTEGVARDTFIPRRGVECVISATPLLGDIFLMDDGLSGGGILATPREEVTPEFGRVFTMDPELVGRACVYDPKLYADIGRASSLISGGALNFQLWQYGLSGGSIVRFNGAPDALLIMMPMISSGDPTPPNIAMIKSELEGGAK